MPITKPIQKESKISHVTPPSINAQTVSFNKLTNMKEAIAAARNSNKSDHPSCSMNSSMSPIRSIIIYLLPDEREGHNLHHNQQGQLH